MRKKCLKCGRSPKEDPNVKLFRFPYPGPTNLLSAESWAKFCFPNGAWHSHDFQQKLYSECRMLCNKHFNESAFTDFAKKILNGHAIPDAEYNEYPSEHLDVPEYVNYYDSMGFKVEKLEKDFPEDGHPQLDFSINYTIIPENKELLELIGKQEVNHENTEEGFSLTVNEENVNKKFQVMLKMEKLEEEQYILDNAGATSVHYDILMNPQEVECKLCSRIFKNGFNLLRHNIEHIKVEINTPGDNNKAIELHQRQYCKKSFNNHNNMLAHVGDVHSKKILKGELCGKHFKREPNLKTRVVLLHKQMSSNQVTGYNLKCKYCNVDYKHKDLLYEHMEQCRTAKEGEEIKYKCDSCEGTYKSERSLSEHVKRTHYDYGRTYDRWCGKQFRSPRHLCLHMKQRHDGNYEKVQCDTCHRKFKSKIYLLKHIKTVHYDYGKVFECWCGKQFRTPINLRRHKRRQHDGNINVTSNDKLTGNAVEKMKYKCDSCESTYASKHCIREHIKNKHYDYGRTFDCECGKQFRTPRHLLNHKRRPHGSNINFTNNYKKEMKYKCDSCESTCRSKYRLNEHIKKIHYDYGRMFDCWCGKQFRIPQYLRNHMRRQHDGKIKDRNNDKVQCKARCSPEKLQLRTAH